MEEESKEISAAPAVNPETKQQFEEIRRKLLADISQTYKEFYPHHRAVVDNNALEFKVISQLGAQVFESKLKTHFVMPTNNLLTNIIPNEYQYKIVSYNIDTSLFIDEYFSTEKGCHNIIISWQEKTYGFNFKEYRLHQSNLTHLQGKADITSEYFSEEENEKYQLEINEALKSIRKELNLLEEDDEQNTDTFEKMKESVERMFRNENRNSAS